MKGQGDSVNNVPESRTLEESNASPQCLCKKGEFKMVIPTVTYYVSLKTVLSRVMVGKFPAWTQFTEILFPLRVLKLL